MCGARCPSFVDTAFCLACWQLLQNTTPSTGRGAAQLRAGAQLAQGCARGCAKRVRVAQPAQRKPPFSRPENAPRHSTRCNHLQFKFLAPSGPAMADNNPQDGSCPQETAEGDAASSTPAPAPPLRASTKSGNGRPPGQIHDFYVKHGQRDTVQKRTVSRCPCFT